MKFEDAIKDLGVPEELVPLIREGFVGELRPEGEELYKGNDFSVLKGVRGIYVVFGNYVLWLTNVSGLELNSIIYSLNKSRDKKEDFLNLIIEFVALKKVGLIGVIAR